VATPSATSSAAKTTIAWVATISAKAVRRTATVATDTNAARERRPPTTSALPATTASTAAAPVGESTLNLVAASQTRGKAMIVAVRP
jgi:hypothetical protein